MSFTMHMLYIDNFSSNPYIDTNENLYYSVPTVHSYILWCTQVTSI